MVNQQLEIEEKDKSLVNNTTQSLQPAVIESANLFHQSIRKYLTILAAFLGVFALQKHSYDYYIMLRYVVCAASIWNGFHALKIGEQKWCAILYVLAVLFNPFVPVHLSRDVWIPIDLLTSCLLAIFLLLNLSRTSK